MFRLDCADAHTWLKTLPDSSVDLVCTDPPFHTTNLPFDKLEMRWPELWREIYRVCKPTAVQVMFSAQPFTTDLIMSNRKCFRYEIIWEKSVPLNFLNCALMPLRAHENILVFSVAPKQSTYNPQRWQDKPKGVINRKRGQEYGVSQHYGKIKDNVQVDDGLRYPTSVQAFSNSIVGSTHPTQKPESLISFLIKTFSNEGDTVLDFCAGSGTTGAVCLLTGRNFIGCELDPSYHNAAVRRLNAISAQTPLNFDPPKEVPDHA